MEWQPERVDQVSSVLRLLTGGWIQLHTNLKTTSFYRYDFLLIQKKICDLLPQNERKVASFNSEILPVKHGTEQ